jgi:Xaa-Pro aminopeptidase
MIHIPKAEYTRRRKALMAQMEPNSIRRGDPQP